MKNKQELFPQITLNKGDTIALVCNSNAQHPTEKDTLSQLIKLCENYGIHVVLSPILYEAKAPFSLLGKEKAKVMMDCYQNDTITAIIDISGGDLANSILPFLDYELIQTHPKPFWGYSDLTTILNAIFCRTNNVGVLYQLKNLVWDTEGTQQQRFASMLNNDTCSDNLFTPDYHFINGTTMDGILIGGNIRCFLKLAGTSYMPDFTNKILLLEGRGGGVEQYATYLSQLLELPDFSKLNGILLGTFSNMEANCLTPTVEELLINMLAQKDQYSQNITTKANKLYSDIPIAKTAQIGHGTDSKAVIIGKEYHF